MIVSRLSGGLGNQMFQYAIGRVLAKKNQTTLLLNTDAYKNQNKRSIEINKFKIQAKFQKKPLSEYMNILLSKLKKKPYIKKQSDFVISEKSYVFDKKILELENEIELEGYWQSYKYFHHLNKDIKNELTLKKPPKISTEMNQLLNHHKTVSLHVRRGDYISDNAASKILGFVGIPYYKRALKKIREKITSPVFFIFSDDVSWCKQHIAPLVKEPIIFSTNQKAVDDFYYLTLCRHNIIANSTFSWWGAYLGNKKNKIVISPKNWFKDKSYKIKDLIPKSWIQL